jgi:hypothetical protein
MASFSDLRVPSMDSLLDGPGPMFHLATRALNLKITFRSMPTMIMIMMMMIATLNAYFAVFYSLETIVWSRGSSTRSAKSGVTVTVPETQNMIISYVTYASNG